MSTNVLQFSLCANHFGFIWDDLSEMSQINLVKTDNSHESFDIIFLITSKKDENICNLNEDLNVLNSTGPTS